MLAGEADVVVVGAGLAGLSAARALAKETSVLVLEARDRVGGRTLTESHGGASFDVGAQWIGPGQTRMNALARELGLETFGTHTSGRKVLELGETTRTYSGTIPSIGILDLLRLHRALRRIDALAKRIPRDRPESAPDAATLDAMTLESWKLSQAGSRRVRDLVDVAVRTVLGAEPSEVSLLHFLAYVSAAGGLMPLVETDKGAQQDRLVLGTQQVSLKLAASLGERIVTGAPVRAIEQDASGVTVRSGDREWRARRAIVAVPPALAGRIEFRPLLPSTRDQLTQRFPMGATVKCLALYDAPFWREAGLSGEAISTRGPVSAVFDNTSRDGRVPALLGFVVGRAARGWSERPEEERRRSVLDAFARLFGPRAARPVSYHEKDWAVEEWTRGCPVGCPSPGTLSAFGRALREPVGRIHWAGTETASEWMGYMEGAVQSGERAAREVLETPRA